MMVKNYGHVVTIASSAGFFGAPGLCDYCASKFGAAGFDESLNMELGALKKDGINTTVVCPFFMNTGMFEGVKTRYVHKASWPAMICPSLKSRRDLGNDIADVSFLKLILSLLVLFSR